MKFIAVLLAVSTAFLIYSPLVKAQSGVATIAAEASVYEDAVNENGGSYDLFCIGNHDADETRRAFIRFTLPAIPTGATVTRVDYNLTQDRVRSQGAGPLTATMEMRRVLQDWPEGNGVQGNGPCGGGSEVAGVTWNDAPNLSATVSASEFLPSTNNTPINIDTDIGNDDDGLIADVQAWVDNPASNFGWEVRVLEEGIADNARRMDPGSMTVHWTDPQVGGVMIVKDGTLDLGGNGISDPGDPINYTFTISNTGDATLTNVAVTDPLVPVITCPSGNPIPSLLPASMEICTGSYAITPGDIDNGVVNNTADVDAMCTAPNCPVNDDDTHMEPIPAPPMLLDFADGFEDSPP